MDALEYRRLFRYADFKSGIHLPEVRFFLFIIIDCSFYVRFVVFYVTKNNN